MATNKEIAQKISGLVNEVAASYGEQSEGIEQINRAIAELETVVQQNAAGAEESASASEQMNSQATEIKRAVDGLVNLAGVQEKKKRNRPTGPKGATVEEAALILANASNLS